MVPEINTLILLDREVIMVPSLISVLLGAKHYEVQGHKYSSDSGGSALADL